MFGPIGTEKTVTLKNFFNKICKNATDGHRCRLHRREHTENSNSLRAKHEFEIIFVLIGITAPGKLSHLSNLGVCMLIFVATMENGTNFV